VRADPAVERRGEQAAGIVEPPFGQRLPAPSDLVGEDVGIDLDVVAVEPVAGGAARQGVRAEDPAQPGHVRMDGGRSGAGAPDVVRYLIRAQRRCGRRHEPGQHRLLAGTAERYLPVPDGRPERAEHPYGHRMLAGRHRRPGIGTDARQARRHGSGDTGQLALAWLLAQGSDVVTIPGLRNPARVAKNAAATDIELSSGGGQLNRQRDACGRRRTSATGSAAAASS
jgi:Aldo/keto reductase family